MADTPPGGKPAGSDAQSVLTRKVGPLPVWVWAVAAVGIWYWYTHYGPGASSSSSTSAQAIDPNTGVPYAEELANAQQAPVPLDINVTDTETPGPTIGAPHPGEPGPYPPPRKPPPRRPPPRKPPPRRPPPRRPPPRKPPTVQNPGPVPGRPPVRYGGATLAEPGQVQTAQSPVYDQWTADHAGVPEPQPAYAPMTAGSIYG